MRDFKKDFSCCYCGGPNHFDGDYRKKKRDQKNGTTNNKKNDSTIACQQTVIICDYDCVSLACQQTD